MRGVRRRLEQRNEHRAVPGPTVRSPWVNRQSELGRGDEGHEVASPAQRRSVRVPRPGGRYQAREGEAREGFHLPNSR